MSAAPRALASRSLVLLLVTWVGALAIFARGIDHVASLIAVTVPQAARLVFALVIIVDALSVALPPLAVLIWNRRRIDAAKRAAERLTDRDPVPELVQSCLEASQHPPRVEVFRGASSTVVWTPASYYVFVRGGIGLDDGDTRRSLRHELAHVDHADPAIRPLVVGSRWLAVSAVILEVVCFLVGPLVRISSASLVSIAGASLWANPLLALAVAAMVFLAWDVAHSALEEAADAAASARTARATSLLPLLLGLSTGTVAIVVGGTAWAVHPEVVGGAWGRPINSFIEPTETILGSVLYSIGWDFQQCAGRATAFAVPLLVLLAGARSTTTQRHSNLQAKAGAVAKSVLTYSLAYLLAYVPLRLVLWGDSVWWQPMEWLMWRAWYGRLYFALEGWRLPGELAFSTIIAVALSLGRDAARRPLSTIAHVFVASTLGGSLYLWTFMLRLARFPEIRSLALPTLYLLCAAVLVLMRSRHSRVLYAMPAAAVVYFYSTTGPLVRWAQDWSLPLPESYLRFYETLGCPSISWTRLTDGLRLTSEGDDRLLLALDGVRLDIHHRVFTYEPGFSPKLTEVDGWNAGNNMLWASFVTPREREYLPEILRSCMKDHSGSHVCYGAIAAATALRRRGDPVTDSPVDSRSLAAADGGLPTWRERIEDVLAPCHASDDTHPIPGLCTRFSQTRELRAAVRRAWGLNETCGECSPHDVTALDRCRDPVVEDCERRVACLVDQTLDSTKCGAKIALGDCRSVLEPAIARHALLALALRIDVWTPDVDTNVGVLREVAWLPPAGAAPEGSHAATVRSWVALESWTPRTVAEPRYRTMIMNVPAPGGLDEIGTVDLMSAAGEQARMACSNVVKAKALTKTVSASWDAGAATSWLALQRLQAWRRAGVCP